MVDMATIEGLCKRRGFIFRSSEIYGRNCFPERRIHQRQLCGEPGAGGLCKAPQKGYIQDLSGLQRDSRQHIALCPREAVLHRKSEGLLRQQYIVRAQKQRYAPGQAAEAVVLV